MSQTAELPAHMAKKLSNDSTFWELSAVCQAANCRQKYVISKNESMNQ